MSDKVDFKESGQSFFSRFAPEAVRRALGLVEKSRASRNPSPREIENLSDALLAIPTQARFSVFNEKRIEMEGYRIIASSLGSEDKLQKKAAWRAASLRWGRAGLLCREGLDSDEWNQSGRTYPLSEFHFFLISTLLEYPNGLSESDLCDIGRRDFYPDWEPQKTIPSLVQDYRIGLPGNPTPLIERNGDIIRIAPLAAELLRPSMPILKLLKPIPDVTAAERNYHLETEEHLRLIAETVVRVDGLLREKKQYIKIDKQLWNTTVPLYFRPGVDTFSPPDEQAIFRIGNSEMMVAKPRLSKDGKLTVYILSFFNLPSDFAGYFEPEKFWGAFTGDVKKGPFQGRIEIELDTNDSSRVETIRFAGIGPTNKAALVREIFINTRSHSVSQDLYAEEVFPGYLTKVRATSGTLQPELIRGLLSDQIRGLEVSLAKEETDMSGHATGLTDEETRVHDGIEINRSNHRIKLQTGGISLTAYYEVKVGGGTLSLEESSGKDIKRVSVDVPIEIPLKDFTSFIARYLQLMEKKAGTEETRLPQVMH